ncbi:MAG: hypothetical protein WC802_02970 [Patescibacteria group bacterium]|jgi:membrane protein YdbS with pleckstrin-like domain
MMRLTELPNSEPEEKVVLVLRRHWIDVVRLLIFTGMLLIVPVVILIYFNLTKVDIFNDPATGPISAVVFSAYFLLVFVLTITAITDYWLDVWIVTSERVIDIEQKGLFNRVVSELHLRQIQDITSEMKGFLATFLTFGDVFIQTAAAKDRFQFKNIDNPDDVKITISKLVEACKLHHGHSDKVDDSTGLVVEK